MLALGCLLSAGLFASNTVTIKQLALEKEGIELIGQLEDVGRDIQFNAEQLQSLSLRNQSSRWTHDHHLMQLRELVNEGLKPALARLSEIRPELKAWHQSTIDRMLDSAGALAADTNSAILNQNERRNVPTSLNPEYKELIANAAKHAAALVKTADAAGDYAAAVERAEEARLRMPKQ
jgi:hypothetical protein